MTVAQLSKKSRKNFFNLCYHKDNFKLNAEWFFFFFFFFATSHGNNSFDVIGGTVKRPTYKISLQHPYKDQIISPLDLFHYCRSNFKNIKFFFASEKYVAETRGLLFERLAFAVRIMGTRDFHKFIPISKSMLVVSVCLYPD